MIELGIYQHYKGQYYQVIGCARHSESLEEMVVYQALYKDYGLWVRPIKMFFQQVLFKGNLIPRFQFISKGWENPPSIHFES